MTDIAPIWMSAEATRSVMRALGDARVWFVGGCVRDAVLGREATDIDIATSLRPKDVITRTEAAGLKAIPTGIDHGTVTVVADHTPFEITTFRKDVTTYGRRATVAFADRLEDDAQRRDFTINALYAAPSGEITDPTGGLADLHAHRIRFIGDPVTRIREDYLRILRFFRFNAWFGNPAEGIDPDGLAACAELAEGLDTLSAERITQELLKLLAAPDPAPATASMARTGILARVLPGADAGALAPLVHVEGGASIDPLRRLAALGGEITSLRLSKAQSNNLRRTRAALESGEAAAVLAYRFDPDTAENAQLIRSATLGKPLDKGALSAEVQRGSRARFPVRAHDLMPGHHGPALGDRLKELEERWIASGFTLSKDELLAGG